MAVREASKPREPRVARAHIYVVTLRGQAKLVRAMSRARAIKHVATPIEAKIATQDELVDMLAQQIAVEDATEVA